VLVADLKEKNEELERELKVLRESNQTELSVRLVKIEQQLEDSQREN